MALNPEMRNTSAVMGCREQKASLPAQALSALTSPRMPRSPAELMYSSRDEQTLLARFQQGAGRVFEFRCRRGVHAACKLHDGDTVLFRYDDFHRTSESGY